MTSSTGIVLLVLGAVAAFAIWIAWQVRSAIQLNRKAASWPSTQATIQAVGTVVVHGGRASSYSVDVCDFSYTINDEYYSGRLQISTSTATGDASPSALIHQSVQVRYNPQKPEQHAMPQTALGGFLLDSFDESVGSEVGSIDLNIDKI